MAGRSKIGVGGGIYLETRAFELMWLLCHAAVNKQLRFDLHPEFMVLAKELEPMLYEYVKKISPGWSHPLREQN